MPSKYKALNDASRLAHAQLTGKSPNPEDQQFDPDYIVTPGAILLDVLDDAGMTQADLARRTGIPQKTLSLISNGKAPISTNTALLLEQVLGTKARFWSSLESMYREHLAKI